MQKALVARAAEFHSQVALGEDEGAVDQGVESFEKSPLRAAFFLELLVGVAAEAPDVPAEFLAAPLGDFAALLGLFEGLAAAESDAGLTLEGAEFGFDFVEIDENAGVEIPGLRILATHAAPLAALSPEHGTQAIAINDVVVLKRTRKPNLHRLLLPRHGLAALFGLFTLGLLFDAVNTVFIASHIVFHPVTLFGFFAVVPALKATNQISGNSSQPFKGHVAFFLDAAATGAAITVDDAGIATDGVAIDRMVDGAVADVAFLHFTDDGFEGFDVVAGVAIKFDVSDMAAVAERVIGGFDFDFFEGTNGIINGNVETISVVIAVRHAFDRAVFFAVDFGEAARKPFAWSGNEAEVEVIFLAIFIAAFAHMCDDVEAELAGFFIFTVVDAQHRD